MIMIMMVYKNFSWGCSSCSCRWWWWSWSNHYYCYFLHHHHLLLLLHEAEILAVGEGDEFFSQHQHQYLDTVQQLLLRQMLGIRIHPINEVLNLMHKGVGR